MWKCTHVPRTRIIQWLSIMITLLAQVFQLLNGIRGLPKVVFPIRLCCHRCYHCIWGHCWEVRFYDESDYLCWYSRSIQSLCCHNHHIVNNHCIWGNCWEVRSCYESDESDYWCWYHNQFSPYAVIIIILSSTIVSGAIAERWSSVINLMNLITNVDIHNQFSPYAVIIIILSPTIVSRAIAERWGSQEIISVTMLSSHHEIVIIKCFSPHIVIVLPSANLQLFSSTASSWSWSW